MLTASVENMLVISIDTTLETGVVPTQYIVIISTIRRQSDSDSRKLVSNVGSTLFRLLISAWGGMNLLYQLAIPIKIFCCFLYSLNLPTSFTHHVWCNLQLTNNKYDTRYA